jgi:DNA-binding transcriptional regulator YdaS (Cro superfamily)
MQVRDLIQEAIRFAGSEAKLGKATGYTQNAIWQAKRRGTVTPQMAVRIDRATNSLVPKEKLRPDVFAPTSEEVAA